MVAERKKKGKSRLDRLAPDATNIVCPPGLNSLFGTIDPDRFTPAPISSFTAVESFEGKRRVRTLSKTSLDSLLDNISRLALEEVDSAGITLEDSDDDLIIAPLEPKVKVKDKKVKKDSTVDLDVDADTEGDDVDVMKTKKSKKKKKKDKKKKVKDKEDDIVAVVSEEPEVVLDTTSDDDKKTKSKKKKKKKKEESEDEVENEEEEEEIEVSDSEKRNSSGMLIVVCK